MIVPTSQRERRLLMGRSEDALQEQLESAEEQVQRLEADVGQLTELPETIGKRAKWIDANAEAATENEEVLARLDPIESTLTEVGESMTALYELAPIIQRIDASVGAISDADVLPELVETVHEVRSSQRKIVDELEALRSELEPREPVHTDLAELEERMDAFQAELVALGEDQAADTEQLTEELHTIWTQLNEKADSSDDDGAGRDAESDSVPETATQAQELRAKLENLRTDTMANGP